MKPGQYFVLRIDFARGEHREDPKNAQLDLQRAIAHALDAEFGEFGDRRHTRSGQNIHGGHPMNVVLKIVVLKIGAQMVDHGLDVLGVAQAA